jgi:hypothetical protein
MDRGVANRDRPRPGRARGYPRAPDRLGTNETVNAMLANSQPQSRWATFVERLDERLTRFRQHFDPFSDTVNRRRKIWAMVGLAVGVVALGALIVLGTMWIIDHYKWFTNHHTWALIVPALKLLKLFGIGVAILAAFLFRDKFTGKPPVAGAQSGGTAPAKE